MTIPADVAARLPEQSRAKLELIEGLALDALGVATAARTRLNQQPRVSPQEADRLSGVISSHQERHRQLIDIVTACTMFVRNVHPKSVIERAEQKLPDGLNGSILEDVKKLRARIGALNVEKLKVGQAPEPKGDVKKQIRARIAELAEIGRPELLLARGKAAVSFEDRRGTDFGVRPDYPGAMLAWMFPGLMTELLEGMVDKLPEGRIKPLTTPAQVRELNRLDGDLAKLEFEEEALLELAFAGGTDIPRRSNASPLAILGIKVVEPARGPERDVEAEIDAELAAAANGSKSPGPTLNAAEAEIDRELAVAAAPANAPRGAPPVIEPRDTFPENASREPSRQRRPRPPRMGQA
jgi:hypothetical protein